MNKNIPVPLQVSLLAEAIACDDAQAARLLIVRSFDIANSSGGLGGWEKKIDDATLDQVIALVKGMQPKDMIEMILACQFVSTHLRSMAKLATNDLTDASQGMMLMRLSHQTLALLQKYRNKGSNINVNYFINNEGQALIQTKLSGTLSEKEE